MILRPLSYDEKLTFEQAQERFQSALAEFSDIKGDYVGGFLNWREYKFLMSKQNRERVGNIVGVLLPLGLQLSVQTEVTDAINSGKSYEKTIHAKAARLMSYAMDMTADFSNTGTRRIGYSKPIWRESLAFN